MTLVAEGARWTGIAAVDRALLANGLVAYQSVTRLTWLAGSEACAIAVPWASPLPLHYLTGTGL